MSTMTKKASTYATLEGVLQSLRSKSAEEAHTEAGGADGATTHPVKNEDDGTEAASTGSRARENEKDVKEDQGEPAVIGEDNGAKSARSKKGFDINQDSVQLNINTKNRATGEDPENETGKAKGGKDDGQYQGASSHPARTDNNEIDGHKWANARFGQRYGQFRNLLKTSAARSDEALASIAVTADREIQKQAEAIRTKQAAGGEATPAPAAPATPADPARQAGAKLAASLFAGQVDSADKQAEYAQVVEDIQATILQSYAAADRSASYLLGLSKSAAEGEEGREEESSEHPSEGGSDSPPSHSEGSGAPPSDAGGGGGGSEGDMLAALTGGAGGGGGGGDPMAGGGAGAPPMGGAGDPTGGAGAPPMGGAGDPMAGGGDPLAAMGGGMPPGGAPGAGGAPGGIDMQMLIAALQQLGISPEQLDGAAQAKVAMQLAQQAKQAQAAQANWRPKNAAENARFDALKRTLQEIVQVV